MSPSLPPPATAPSGVALATQRPKTMVIEAKPALATVCIRGASHRRVRHARNFITTNSQAGRSLLDTLPETSVTQFQRPLKDERAVPADFKARASQYAGTYSQLRRSYTTAEKIRALGDMVNVAAIDDGHLRIGSGPQSALAVEIGKDLFKQVGGDATFAFKRDSQGRITYLVAVVGAFQFAADKLGFFQAAPWFAVILILGIVNALSVVAAALWRGVRRTTAPAGFARYASVSLTCAALAWIGVVAALAAFVTRLLDVVGQDQILMHFPPAILKAAMVFVMVGALATAASVAAMALTWPTCKWSPWRKGRYVVAVAIVAALAATFTEWNLLGFRYY